jgi:hypothetical protein
MTCRLIIEVKIRVGAYKSLLFVQLRPIEIYLSVSLILRYRRIIRMKPNKIKRLLAVVSLVIMLFVGIGSATANAQRKRVVRRPARVIVYRAYNPFWYRYYDPFWDPFYYPRYQAVDPIAYQRESGYREGRDEGKEDAKRGRLANATRNEDYLKSDSIHFREAFVQGYNAGYREKLADTKEDLRDKGRSKGKEDAKKGRPANPASHEAYAKATSPAYRQAFVQGYIERYREQIRERQARADD